MSIAVEPGVVSAPATPGSMDPFPSPPTNLIAEDGVPLESDWHRLSINLLVECVRFHWRDRDDFFVGGNMFIYFNAQQARNRDFRGPDFFLARGVVKAKLRDYWAIWDEGGKYPSLIIELMSLTTRLLDLGEKKQVYQDVFNLREYFCFDPADQKLLGWKNANGQFEAMTANADGRMYCSELGLFLGLWEGTYQDQSGTWLRLFDAQGRLVLTAEETAEGQLKKERQKSAAERQRAEAAEAEVARLKKLLAEKA